jgi:PAS domain S-box-containing protein
MILLIQNKVRNAVKILSLISLSISLLVLLGWAFDITVLKTIVPGYISMKVNTALGLGFMALALLLMKFPKSKIREAVMYSSAAIVFAIGLLTLLQYLTGANFGIDEFFFKDPVSAGAMIPAGRLAPITAVNFILMSLGLTMSIRKVWMRTAQFLIFVAFLISFQALVSYLLGTTDSFGAAFYTRMALHTAFLFSFLSIGMLLARPQDGLMEVLGSPLSAGAVSRKLMIAAMLVPPVVAWIQVQGQNMKFYDADFGTLLKIMGNIVFLLVVIWRVCLELKGSEESRIEAQRALQISNSDLEKKVFERTQAFQESEAQVRAILNSALDAIIGMDSEGMINEWNPRAESMFGWKKEEVLGRKLSSIIVPEAFREAHDKGLARFFKTKTSKILNQNLELVAIRKDQTEFPIELSVSAIPLTNGFVFTAFISDISKRKDDEAQMKKLNLELEMKVQEAKQASELKSFFLANMSHEIRTPINGVIGMTGLVLDTNLNSNQREYCEIIKASANSLLYIVNDILDLSKIEAGKLELEKIDFEITSVLGDLHRSMVHTAQAKDLSLTFDIPKSLTVNVNGDPGRLRQIFLNLISNAIKFTEKGSVHVSGKVSEETSESIHLQFEVQDSGIGISAETLPRLFQPFSQADQSTTRRFGGTGLGLSICQHMVEMMGGQIGVRSVLNQGTTFWFTVQLEKSRNAVIQTKKERDVRSSNFKGRVLVVEDNPVNQKVARAVLEKLGHQVTVAGNGVEALKSLDQNPFDLVLMDCQMPEMDGFEATSLIRMNGTVCNRKDIPIIAMTANAISGDREKCLAAGMDDYISKPVQVDKLEKMVSDWLRRDKVRSA